MSGLARDGTAEPASRDRILRHERLGKINFPFAADHEQDCQPYMPSYHKLRKIIYYTIDSGSIQLDYRYPSQMQYIVYIYIVHNTIIFYTLYPIHLELPLSLLYVMFATYDTISIHVRWLVRH